MALENKITRVPTWRSAPYTQFVADDADKVEPYVSTYCSNPKSMYCGHRKWPDVTAVYKALKRNHEIDRIVWMTRDGQLVNQVPESLDEARKNIWNFYCFFIVTVAQAQSWFSPVTNQVEKLCSKFWSLPESHMLFIHSNVANIADAKHVPIIQAVLTEDQFLRKFCHPYYDSIMLKRELKQYALDSKKAKAQEALNRTERAMKEAKAQAELVKDAAKRRIEAEELRAEQEQIIAQGGMLPQDVAKQQDATGKKRHRGKRGGRNHNRGLRSPLSA